MQIRNCIILLYISNNNSSYRLQAGKNLIDTRRAVGLSIATHAGAEATNSLGMFAGSCCLYQKVIIGIILTECCVLT